jgi:glycosyltransferase involved in cell wall biosynthesis
MDYSVIICSFNKLRYLKLVVDALKAAVGGGRREFILSDDGSDDGTLDWSVKRGFFDKVVVHGGGSYRLNSLRNSGVRLASCEHVVILDADCVPQPSYFSGHDAIYAHNVAVAAGGEVISVGFTDYYDEDGKAMIHEDLRKKGLKGGDTCPIRWNDAFGGNISFPKSVWEKIGGFDEDYNGCWGFDDLDYAYRAGKKDVKIVAHRESLVRHYRHPVRKDNNLKNRNNRLFCDKHGFPPC